jgi:hypothetical protein
VGRPSALVGLVGLAGGCQFHPPAATVASAAEVGTLTQSPRIVGRDGPASTVAWGHAVWTFGDTFLSVVDDEGTNFVSNTLATSQTELPTADAGSLALADRLDDAGAPDQFLQPTTDEEAYDLAHRSLPDGGCSESPCGGRWATWPATTVFDPTDGGTALTFYSLITAAPGNFNFSGVGQSIAVWRDFNDFPTRPEPGGCPPSPTLLFCADEPAFGVFAAEVDGGLFAFGCSRSGLSFPCQLGTVPFARALERSAWSYWDGKAWSSDLAAAQTLFDGASIGGLFFDAHVGAWMAVYSRPLSNLVVFRTAPSLTGPWSDEGQLFVPDLKGSSGPTYDARPHPELSEDEGRTVYITFSRSTGVFSSEIALVRVDFE